MIKEKGNASYSVMMIKVLLNFRTILLLLLLYLKPNLVYSFKLKCSDKKHRQTHGVDGK